MINFKNIDVRELNDSANALMEQSDQGGMEAMFGDCESIEDINSIADEILADNPDLLG